MGWLGLLWRVDPDICRDLWWFWALADEPLRRAWERSIKRDLAGGMDGAGLPDVDLIWRHQPDACVMMVFRDDGFHHTRRRNGGRRCGPRRWSRTVWGILADISVS